MIPEINFSAMGAHIHIHTYDLFVWISMATGLAMAYGQLIRMGTGRRTAASFMALYISSYRLKADFLELMDRLIFSFLLSYFIMKIGCFLNGCCYGKMTKSAFSVPLPLREQATLDASPLISQFFGSPELRVYPAQLMEASAAILIIAAVLLSGRLIEKKIKATQKEQDSLSLQLF